MNDLLNVIQDLAYTELLITCQVEGCQSLFQRSVEEPATDPVDEWAKTMAKFARDAGWSVDASGRVLCPIHNRLGEDSAHSEE